MDKQHIILSTIYQEVEKILDEWDPIGILQEAKPITYLEGLLENILDMLNPSLPAICQTNQFMIIL